MAFINQGMECIEVVPYHSGALRRPFGAGGITQ
jgi:hypothetical protein